MSWFTAPVSDITPLCPRCSRPDFVRLVKRIEDQTDLGETAIFDCKSCPIPTTRSSKDA